VAVSKRALAGTFNVCSGRAVPIRDLVEGLTAASAIDVLVEVDADRLRPADVPVLFGSFDRLRGETGWEPRIELGHTLADLLESWRERVASR
jgi:nucleoside-diphosphate-sugar epimerase